MNFTKVLITTPKKDSAFVYALFESIDGLCAYSTLDSEVGSMERTLEVWVPAGQLDVFKDVLGTLNGVLSVPPIYRAE